MPYDPVLADRLRELVADQPGITEKRMFGGHAFLLHGNLAVSASSRGGLLVRVDPAETDALCEKPHVDPFVMRGRPMQGWLFVATDAIKTKRQLEPWVRRGLAYAGSLKKK